MKRYIDNLQQLGFGDKEARLYLAALEHAPASVVTLAKYSGVKRGTIYEFLEQLVQKGIIEVEVSGKRRLYRGTDPKNLKRLVERQQAIVDELIPDLALLLPTISAKPKVRFFEGKEGILSLYDEILELPGESEVIGYATFSGVYEVYSEHAIRDYIRRRVAGKITQRLIMPIDDRAQAHSNEAELREVKMVPSEQFPIKNEINVYQNKVAIISLGLEKIGMIIESAQVADTQRAIFELLWRNLE